jgi:hypothetical protein
MNKKLVILEFEVDQNLEVKDLISAVSDAKILVIREIDRQLDRLGNGKGSAAGMVTVRFQNFGCANWVSRNGGQFRLIRRRTP